MRKRRPFIVDTNGFVIVDGVKICRAVREGGEVVLVGWDKNCHRATERGSREVSVALNDLVKAVGDGNS